MNTISTSLDVKDAVRLKEYEDDIDLLGIVRAVGKTWKQWLIALVVVTLAYLGYAVVQYLKAEEFPVYRKAIGFTFPGVEEGRYPNGSHFSLEDIIAPVIVNDVYNINKLEEYDIGAEQFRTAITIEPYAPGYFMIVEKYNRLLDNLRPKAEEVNQLQERMQSELSTINKGAALLSLHLHKLPLPESVVEKVMIQIPEFWAKRVIQQKGVLDLNIKLSTSRAIDKGISGQVDYMLISDYLAEKTSLVEGNIEKLLQMKGAALIVDPESGLKLADVQQEINDLQRYVIDEIMSPVRSLGLSRNVDMALYYYQDKRQTLQNSLNLLKNQATLVKNALDSYKPLRMNEQITIQDTSTSGTVSQQLSADAMDKLIGFSSEIKTEAYRQGLNHRWLELEIKTAELTHQIGEVDRLITALKRTEKNTAYSSIRERYLTRAEEKLPGILDRLREFLDITQRIYHQLSLENIGISGHLYSALSNKPYIKETEFSVKKNFLILAALLFLTTIIIVPAIMIRNAMRARGEA